MVPYALSGLPRCFHSPARVSVFGLALSALAVAGSSSCDQMPLTAPAGTVITLVSVTNVLPVNGNTDVVAVLIENGTTGTGNAATGSAGTPVHNGTVVTFTTTIGRIEPSEARTHNGRVTVKLIADGRSGTATISAFSGAATKTLDVKIGAAAAERVALTASPTSVPANGGTAQLTARVEDIGGNPIVGVPVVFTTTAGTLGAPSSLTNEIGIATTSLSTTTEATVTATAGGKTASATVRVKARPFIAVSVPAGSVFVGATATITVTPGSATVLSGGTIDFGDGETRPLGAISSVTTFQHAYDDDGIFQVTVRATDVDGAPAEHSGQLSVIPWSFSATASPTSGVVSTTNFTFSVTGIPTTVPIDQYEWDFGDGTGRRDNDGASTTHIYTTPGTKTVRVTVVPVTGPTRSHTFEVSVTPPPGLVPV